MIPLALAEGGAVSAHRLGIGGGVRWARVLGLAPVGVAGARGPRVDPHVAPGVHNAVTDPVNGPALLREAGQGYVTQSYVAHAVSIAATVVGLVWASRPGCGGEIDRGNERHPVRCR